MALQLFDNITSWLPRALMLLAIWGVAVFLWGTFGAWTHSQYTAGERAILQSHAEEMRGWLEQAVAPLDQLASDPRIAAGMDLPAGVESLPIQRVMYEYGYLTRQTEVYMVDLLHHRVGQTAGAAPLPAEVTQRLADLPDAEHMLMGMGIRNGQMLLVRKVTAPLPNRLFAVVPVSLATLAAGQPTPQLPEGRTMGVVVPHPMGWAEWRNGQAGFIVDGPLNDAVDAQKASFENKPFSYVIEPIAGWPSVMLDLQSPAAISGARLMPQLLVALWAIMMSLMVLWQAGKVYQDKIVQAARPVLGPMGKMVGPLKAALHSMSDAVAARWNEANRETPLVDGPGAFGTQDFITADQLAHSQRKPRSATKPMNLTQAAPEIAQKVMPKIKNPQPQRAAAWPNDRMKDKPREFESLPLPEKPAAFFDKDDIRAVIEDCLKRKRLRLLYQPIYRAGDNLPVMHEVYARLLRANGEMITPDIFLPIAIKHKMVLELDLIVLRKVVHEHFSGGEVPLTPLALNISSTSLDGIAYLQEMANQGPRVLQKMSFEVRSQEMIRDPKALRLLKDLQKQGGNLAVDYFGGGNAMLEASKSIGFNYVKLSCGKFLDSDNGKEELMGLCTHAKELGLPIILEMVGDDKALAFARESGAEFLQGYALARPSEKMTIEPLMTDMGEIKNLAGAR